MSNIACLIPSLITSFLLCICLFSNCHGEVFKKKIRIDCSPSFEEATEHFFPSIPGFKKSLITRGIKIAGQDKLITENDGQLDSLYITAFCFGIDDTGEYQGTRIYLFPESDLTSTELHCQENEGIKIFFRSPNSDDPNHYQYLGTIINSNEDIDSNTEKREESKLPKRHRKKNRSRPGSPLARFISPPPSRSSSSSSLNELDLDLRAIGASSPPSFLPEMPK